MRVRTSAGNPHGCNRPHPGRVRHWQGPRSPRNPPAQRPKPTPAHPVNCASVPRDLYESEFFGHVKGAFTGAIKDRAGRFEAADGGTLLLDEVGEIPFGLQSKFLRVLQEKQYERVGEERTRSVDVRILAATNRDLRNEVEEGRFREDLFYRLNVVPVEVPPLRDRKEDLPALAAHFLQQAAGRLHLALPRFSDAHVRLFRAMTGPEMCASCKTPWSARSSWPRTAACALTCLRLTSAHPLYSTPSDQRGDPRGSDRTRTPPAGKAKPDPRT